MLNGFGFSLFGGVFCIHGWSGAGSIGTDARYLEEGSPEEDTGLATLHIEPVGDLPDHFLEKKGNNNK
jgi:hypothetical protein